MRIVIVGNGRMGRAIGALAEARGTLFLPLDAHTILSPGAVQRLTTALQRHEDWAGVVAYALLARRPADIAHEK